MTRIELKRVHFMPMELEAEILYVSEAFNIAGHLCPCGCGNKVMTPIGPTEWSVNIEDERPTMYPSMGNWQLPCKSHYWIIDGEIEWSFEWSDEQIKAGEMREEGRRRAHFERPATKSIVTIFIEKILGLLGFIDISGVDLSTTKRAGNLSEGG